MFDRTRLGGFTVREKVAWASLTHRRCEGRFPSRLARLLALERINLPFFSCRFAEHGCAVDMAVDENQWNKTATLIEENFAAIRLHAEKRSGIASIFPHGRNPAVAAKVLRSIHGAGIRRCAFAQSNSALSVLIEEQRLQTFAEALFTYFRFPAYPTFRDWECRRTPVEVPKEIVASYQEKRPKVYSLDWHEGMELLSLENSRGCDGAAQTLENMAVAGGNPRFVSGGGHESGAPYSAAVTLAVHGGVIAESPPDLIMKRHPVAVFTMNGPHFGDRYGIAGELMSTLEQHDVDMLALACNMASVTGIIPGNQVSQALKAITGCFDIPAVTRTLTEKGTSD